MEPRAKIGRNLTHEGVPPTLIKLVSYEHQEDAVGGGGSMQWQTHTHTHTHTQKYLFIYSVALKPLKRLTVTKELTTSIQNHVTSNQN